MSISETSTPALSICIPTFNRARYLDCLLADLVSQIGRSDISYEILIGDNCSDDKTPEVARRYSGNINIRYFRRECNIGGAANLAQLFSAAAGKYLIYLADDDLLLLDAVGEALQILDENPNIGAVFAPWLLHDRVTGNDLGLFYSLDIETNIQQGDYLNLFALLVNRHLFPEIFIARTELMRSIFLPANTLAFFYFTQVAAMLGCSALYFAKKPFYRSVTRYFIDESRTQAGHEEVKIGWDRYRGGLEHILSRFASVLTQSDLEKCRKAIDHFAMVRMSVALRLRTADARNWIDNYYLASRLRSANPSVNLPVPYDVYRANAALEHLAGLMPFLPEPTKWAYFSDDPPKILMTARGFSEMSFTVLGDHRMPVPDHTVLVVAERPQAQSATVLVVKEADLLQSFP